jgi:chemotaxis protein methyltransferase CheR
VSESHSFSDEDLRRLSEFLYRRTGMVFNEGKRYYVERRLIDRMQATGAQSFNRYFSILRTDGEGEVEHFINAFTVNETYFYREEHQLECLSKDLLRERVEGRARAPLRILSAPCSTGEEPYSIAMWLLENWSLVDEHEIEIIGADIDTRALERAREGVYSKRALMRLDSTLVERYFEALDEESWRIIEDLRGSIQFRPINLVEARDTAGFGQFDVIFCRNVLIYFDDASRRMAADNLYSCLSPGGFICLGHSESMSRISPLFDVRRFGDAIVYQRPEGEGRG